MSSRKDFANALRVLAMDAVQKANSGHPGMPMGMADIAEVLWRDFLRVNPNNPNWANRDRFVLSNGHGAMLLYGLLHLSGFDLSIEDIKNFRQLNSKTPGHPECTDTPGVETTTGPLGQGLANGVGMAIAEKSLAAHFNRGEHVIVDHYTYVFAGDGCLMEGISHEACSLAGTLGLGKLIVFYDDNGISIDGEVSGWFTDDTPKRFDAYQWHVIPDVDGHDADAISAAIEAAKADTNRPTLICCKTKIGYGSPNMVGTAASHGAPLGDDEIAKTREALAWPHAPFDIPEDIQSAWDAREKGRAAENSWNKTFAKYETAYPELAAEFLRRYHRALPEDWQQKTEDFIQDTQKKADATATRKASLACLNAFSPMLPELMGGSADLTGSNCTAWSNAKILSKADFTGDYIEYGVREFAMSAICNGLALHGGFIPFSGTFLVFSDYARNAVRLSALMKQRVIYVYTHDSIGLGEDGPTHQPIEHASSLRLIPGFNVWRPCDLTETAVAWQQAIAHSGPTGLLLTRQTLAHQTRTEAAVKNIQRGGYVLFDKTGRPDGLIIATGSEVELAIEAATQLGDDGIDVRVVSMPCCEVFRSQDKAYRESVIPHHIKARVAIEAGISDYWYGFVGDAGVVIGIDRFGKSAPANAVYADLGLTSLHLKQTMLTLLKKHKEGAVQR